MRIVRSLFSGLFLVSVAAGPAIPVEKEIEGAWEGFIDWPRRPVGVGLEFRESEGAWQGTIDIPGAEDVPLSDIVFEPPHLRFVLQVESETIMFEATIDGDTIRGKASEFAFSLDRVLELPQPANRGEAWRQDLDIVLERFLKYDRSFSPESEGACRRAIEAIEASVGEMSDPEITVAIARAVALSGNAHTRLYLLRNRSALRRYPLRVWWFGDELRVIRATSEHADTLGCRVRSLGGNDPLATKQVVAELFAGNESWVDYKSTYYLTSPEILLGTGLISDMEALRIGLECRGSGRRQTVVAPLPPGDAGAKTEAWWDLTPIAVGDGSGAWSHVLQADALPLYLSHPDRHYWYAVLEDRKLLYFQFNRAKEMDDGPPFNEFARELLAALDAGADLRFVLDLRFNTGGNNGIAWKLMETLAAHEKLSQPGRFFVITGRSTFSAGISHAAQLKQDSRAIFVGEPVGDVLDTWSEGGNLVLPNSGLTVHYTNGFHGYSGIDYPERRPYFQELNVERLEPDLPITLSFEDYLEGRDPALAAILGHDARNAAIGSK
jgi:hypothetical protein